MSEIINRELAIQKVEELARKQLSKANVNCVSVNAGEVIDCLSELPTVDEKEIIRKAFERVVERLKLLKYRHFPSKTETIEKAIEIVKEECGISE